MKIQCDVCNREEASVFCSADEAALCHGCDQRVHHANKLASKHHRFSLIRPSCEDAPRCDVCQERRAFLFCREDRAVLCRECDLPIHTANEHTKNHNRFLLPGVKLSSCFTTNNTPSSSNTCDVPVESMMTNKSQSSMKKKSLLVSVSPELHDPPPPLPSPIDNSTPTPSKGHGYIFDHSEASEGGSTSSISEYLIQMLPGWHVEEFLDSSAPTNGFCKTDDLFLNADLETNLHCFPSKDLGIWVPQAPSPHPPQFNEQQNGMFKELKEVLNPTPNVSRRWDHGFTVPQITPPSNKRSRLLW